MEPILYQHDTATLWWVCMCVLAMSAASDPHTHTHTSTTLPTPWKSYVWWFGIIVSLHIYADASKYWFGVYMRECPPPRIHDPEPGWPFGVFCGWSHRCRKFAKPNWGRYKRLVLMWNCNSFNEIALECFWLNLFAYDRISLFFFK